MPKVMDSVRRDKYYSVSGCVKVLRLPVMHIIRVGPDRLKKENVKKKILNLVIEHRLELPRGGGKKLYKAMEPDFITSQIKFGRDKLLIS